VVGSSLARKYQTRVELTTLAYDDTAAITAVIFFSNAANLENF
jgi:hypothetical protein